MNGYISVKNWTEFQQYKDRDPKWIKLHRNILNDYDFDQLTEIQQNHLMKIWLLASKLDNKIPNDSVWIGRQIGAKSKVDLKQLVTHGFVLLYETVQDCTGTYLETETETEREREKPQRKKRATSLTADWKLPDDYREYCKNKRPELDPDLVAENFKDYHLGHGKRMVDWKRTWQRWVRNEHGTSRQKGNGAGKQPISPATANREAAAKYFGRSRTDNRDLVAEND